ncbi:TetR/AcrR family transcriptional regulator [bacterium]|nr:MAG: TetR/AcrR family transcriptional regulator [bacterium]
MDALFTQIKISVNESIYLKDPESSTLGKSIVSESIHLIHELGFEQFTIKKLADSIGSTESSIYRYFENKHKLLLYLISWYWIWLEYKLVISTSNISQFEQKIRQAISVLIHQPEEHETFGSINLHKLYKLVTEEAPKTYMTKEVDDENQHGVYLVYKRICNRISEMIVTENPAYAYPHTLVSMIMDAIHRQQYYAEHLPSLCDAKSREQLSDFTTSLVLKSI